jgi:hypothetical protein
MKTHSHTHIHIEVSWKIESSLRNVTERMRIFSSLGSVELKYIRQ